MDLRPLFRFPAQDPDPPSALHNPLTHEQIVFTLRGFVGSRKKAPIVTDADWSYGQGRVIGAPIASHLLTLTGRPPSTPGNHAATS